MNKIVLLLLAFSALLTEAKAGDSCQILLNNQIIFKGIVDQDNAAAILKMKHFKSTDVVSLKYFSENTEKGWQRTFYFDDPNKSTIKKVELAKQTGSVSVSASVLNISAEKKRPVFIYTTSLPVDKLMAARIRVRRMFICKIEWN